MMKLRMHARLRAFACAVMAMAALSACGAAGGNGTTPRYDAAASCVPGGAAPALSLVGPDAEADGVLVRSASDAPPFRAFVQFSRLGGPPLTGGELLTTTPPPGAATGVDYYAAALPELEAGEAYDVTAVVVAYTNLAPECQKSFTIALGRITAH